MCIRDSEWNKLVKSLKKRNTVYTIDLLGCGHSEKPNLTYTNFLYVQLLTDFIKTIIGEKTDVIATGTSSSFVLMACANDDSLFDRIMMINPTNLSTLATIPTKRTKLLRYLLLTPLIGTFLYNILMSKRLSDQNFFEENFHNPEAVSYTHLDVYKRQLEDSKQQEGFTTSTNAGNHFYHSIIFSLNQLL